MTRLAKDLARKLAVDNKRLEWSPTIQAMKWHRDSNTSAKSVIPVDKGERATSSSQGSSSESE